MRLFYLGSCLSDDAMSLPFLPKWINVFLYLIWTATFAIKFSLLAFFNLLIRDVSRK